MTPEEYDAIQRAHRALRPGDPAGAAELDRYTQSYAMGRDLPLPFAPAGALANIGLTAAYEGTKALPPAALYLLAEGLRGVGFGDVAGSFEPGAPGSGDATAPASASNVAFAASGYADATRDRLRELVDVARRRLLARRGVTQ